MSELLIEAIFPQVVGAKANLRDQLLQECAAAGISAEEAESLLSVVPPRLLASSCFLDRLTRFWRYEFGIPFNVNNGQDLVWGTHMWVPVTHLFAAISAAHKRLDISKKQEYLARLADPSKHQDALCEMAPIIRLDASVSAEFEVAALSDGNQTVDWVLGPVAGRKVMFDVKRRVADFIKQADRFGDASGGAASPPDHNPAILFRSVEKKLPSNDPASSLQGVWIATEIKQDAARLLEAFEALDKTKVHFAILGDWQNDIYVLTRRSEDKKFLLDLFASTESARFTFDRQLSSSAMDRPTD
jgi:hypothetical protein